jgi:putative ABC transport system permease protein
MARVHVADIQARLRMLGGGLLIVSPNQVPPHPGRTRQLQHFISLTPEDGAALAAELPQVQQVVPAAVRNTTVQLGGMALRVRLVGTTPEYEQLRGFTLQRGRFFQAREHSDRVIVLGHAISQDLQPNGVHPGQEVYLAATPYQVTGVLQPQGINFAGEDEDHQVFIPLDTYRRRVANRPWLNHLYVQLSTKADAPATTRRLQELLREQHGQEPEELDDVVVRDMAEMASHQTELLATATWAVAVTSGLLLTMGVAGIVTLMILVVRQRRTEIALRRAFGATPAIVALQFFLEGTALAAAGVLVGLVLGSGGAVLVVRLLAAPVPLHLDLLVWSTAVSLGTSAVACTLPALLAARIDPGITLRV